MGARLKSVVGTSTTDRVVFCGPLGVGKTTAVRTVSDVEVANTDVRRAGSRHAAETSDEKTTTTVGIDYGEWRPAGSTPVAVFGTPGQVRFDTVRASTMSGSLHTVLWLYGHTDYAVDEAEEWLRYLAVQDATVYERMTVAVTRLEEPGEHPGLGDFATLLKEFGDIPVIAADPRDRTDVERVVSTALGRPWPVTEAAS